LPTQTPMGLPFQFDLSVLTGKARPLIGLDISSSSVKLVELSEVTRGVRRVERYCIEPLPPEAVADGNITDLDAVADTVSRAWKRLGSTTRNVALALPAAAVITKKIIVAAGLREQELEAQVEAEAGHYVPFPLDEVSLDFQVIGAVAENADEEEVLLAASRREKVEDRVAAADAAGLHARVVDVESYAALAAFALIQEQLPDNGEDKIIALVDVGAHLMTVSILRNGEVLYTREQAFGGNQLTLEVARQYGLSNADAETRKRSGDLPATYDNELRRPFVENLAVEVSRALQFFFSSTHHNLVDHIVLAGGCAAMEGAAQILGQRTQVKTTVGNPFAGMALAPAVKANALEADAPALLVACGLALRRFDPQ
jgi:type IV pilus assembly protein PilM